MTRSVRIRPRYLEAPPKPAREHVANNYTISEAVLQNMVLGRQADLRHKRENLAVILFVSACALIVFIGGVIIGGH